MAPDLVFGEESHTQARLFQFNINMKESDLCFRQAVVRPHSIKQNRESSPIKMEEPCPNGRYVPASVFAGIAVLVFLITMSLSYAAIGPVAIVPVSVLALTVSAIYFCCICSQNRGEEREHNVYYRHVKEPVVVQGKPVIVQGVPIANLAADDKFNDLEKQEAV